MFPTICVIISAWLWVRRRIQIQAPIWGASLRAYAEDGRSPVEEDP